MILNTFLGLLIGSDGRPLTMADSIRIEIDRITRGDTP